MKTNFKQHVIIALVFILNVLLVGACFFPNLKDLDVWDEAIYINGGRFLIDNCDSARFEFRGRLPAFSGYPLLPFFYALIYIPVKTSVYCLIHSCTIGRFILFGLLWMSSYLIACQVSFLVHPFIIAALLVISAALPILLYNPSDAMFVAMSGFALWQVLSFYNGNKIASLWRASVFMGLAALARNDGFVLFVIFLALNVYLSIPVKKLRASLVACITPFATIVLGYFLIFYLVTGQFDSGITMRSYLAFEQGHGFVYGKGAEYGQINCPRLFGTAEDNQHSIIRAIKHNPKAFLNRVYHSARTIPQKINWAYGRELGIMYLLLAAIGVYEIARRRLYRLLVILLLWPAHVLVYFLTFFRVPYFLYAYPIVFIFVAAGLTSVISNRDKRVLGLLSACLATLIIFGNVSYSVAPAALLLVGLWAILFMSKQYQRWECIKPLGIILALVLIALLRKDYHLHNFRTLGIAADERAVQYMREHLPPRSLVLAEAPGKVWCAKMAFSYLDSTWGDKSKRELLLRIGRRNIKAVYLDKTIRDLDPSRIIKMEQLLGEGLDVGFKSEDGKVQVLLPDMPLLKKALSNELSKIKQYLTENMQPHDTILTDGFLRDYFIADLESSKPDIVYAFNYCWKIPWEGHTCYSFIKEKFTSIEEIIGSLEGIGKAEGLKSDYKVWVVIAASPTAIEFFLQQRPEYRSIIKQELCDQGLSLCSISSESILRGLPR